MGGLAAATLWLASGYLLGRGRQRAERELTNVFHAPARIGSLELSLVPLRLRVNDLHIGEESPILAVREATVRMSIPLSLQQARPVLTLTAAGVLLDVDRLPKPPPGPKKKHTVEPVGLFPFEVIVRQIEDSTVRFTVDHQPVSVIVPAVQGRVGVAALRAYLTLAADATGVRLQRTTRSLPLTTVHLEGGVRADQFFLGQGDIEGEGVSVQVTGTALPPSAEHTVTARLPLAALAVLLKPLEDIDGRAHVQGKLVGDLFDPDVDATAQVEQGTVAGLAIGDATGRVTRRGKQIEARQVAIKAWGGHATANFELTASGEVPAKGNADWEDLDATKIGNLGGTDSAWSLPSKGSLQLTGTLDPLDLHIDSTASLSPKLASSQAVSARLRAQLAIERHQLELKATLDQGSANQARLALALKDERALSGTIALSLPDVAQLAPLAPARLRPGLAGRVGADATVAGTLDEPQVTATVQGDDLTIAGAAIPSLQGNVEWAGARLKAKTLRLATAGGSADLSGLIALNGSESNDWQLTIKNLDLSPLIAAADFLAISVPVHGGVADGTASGRGRWSALDLEADLRLQHLWVRDEPIDEIAMQAHVSGGSWRSRLQVTHAKTESLTATGEGQGTRQVRLEVESSPWQLSNLRGAGRHDLRGRVKLQGNASGPLDRLSGSLDVGGEDLVVGGRPVGKLAVTATGSDGAWSAEVLLPLESLRLRATVQTAGEGPFTLNGDWTRAELSTMLTSDPSLHIETSGSFTLRGRLTAPLDLAGSVRIPEVNVSKQEYRFGTTEPILVEGEHGRFKVVSFSLAGEDSRLTLRGNLSTAGLIDLNVEGGGDLTLLEFFVEPIRGARGTFSITAHVGRTEAGEWKLGGAGSLGDAALDFGLPVAFTGTNAKFSLEGSRIRIDELSGEAGGGTFAASGGVDLERGPELSWKLKEISVTLDDGLEATLTGQGAVRGTWQQLKVNGDIEVVNALYDRNLELADLLPWFKEHIVPAPRIEPSVREVQLDLRIYAHDSVFVDNNFAKAEMWLNLQLVGNTEKPVLTGTIGFLSGQVTFRDRTFTLTAGTIDFEERLGMNPVLNITAESQVSTPDAEYTVTAAVSGTADDPRVQFSADDPNLSQNDVLSLVTFGKTQAQLQKEGGGISAADALALLPTRGVEQRVSQLVGVDRFEITASQARDTGAIEPRVTIGKDLTDRFRALASGSFGVEARRTVQLEYRVTQRISLLGTWESQTQSQAGAFGGDVKFRYEFRRLPLSLFSCSDDDSARSHAR